MEFFVYIEGGADVKRVTIFLLLLLWLIPLQAVCAEGQHKVKVHFMPFDVEKKDSGNIEVIDLPDDYAGNPETGSGPGKGETPETGEGPGKGGSPGTGDDPGKGDTTEKDGSPDSGGGLFPWLGDQLSKFVDNATNVANDLWKWGKEKAGELGEQVAQAAEETWEWVKENKEFVAVTAVGVTLTVAGVFFPPLMPFGVSLLAGEAISGGVSYAFGTRGKDLFKEMAIGGALSVMGMGVGALAAKAGRSIVSKVLTSRPIAAMAAAVKNSRAAAWLASGARLAARPFQAAAAWAKRMGASLGSRVAGAFSQVTRGLQAAGSAAARWLQRSRLGAVLVSAGRGVALQAASFANAIRNSMAGRAAARLGSQAARSIQTALSRVAVSIYRQSRGSEAAAGVSASIAEDKMRGKDISWTKAVLSGSLAALLVFGGSAAQKHVNQTAVNADTTVAAVQMTVEGAGNPHLERAVAGDNVGVMLSSKGMGEVKPFDIVTYNPKNPPLENHHGVLDTWAKNNIPGYKERPPKSPTIALTKEQHDATKAVYREWLYERTGKRVGGKVDWTKVSPQEIQKLSERMFDVAKVPEYARRNYYEEFHKFIYNLEP